MSKDSAICGNCGCKKYRHYQEIHNNELYLFCNKVSTGDLFTDEPSEHQIYNYIMIKEPKFMTEIINRWKEENGHEY